MDFNDQKFSDVAEKFSQYTSYLGVRHTTTNPETGQVETLVATMKVNRSVHAEFCSVAMKKDFPSKALQLNTPVREILNDVFDQLQEHTVLVGIAIFHKAFQKTRPDLQTIFDSLNQKFPMLQKMSPVFNLLFADVPIQTEVLVGDVYEVSEHIPHVGAIAKQLREALKNNDKERIVRSLLGIPNIVSIMKDYKISAYFFKQDDSDTLKEANRIINEIE